MGNKLQDWRYLYESINNWRRKCLWNGCLLIELYLTKLVVSFLTQPFEIVHINFFMKFRISMFDWINNPRMLNLKIKKESFDQLRIEESMKKLKYLNRECRIHIIYSGEYYHRNFNTLKSMIYKAMKKWNVKTIVLTLLGMGRFYLIIRVLK